jgi:hypothetical protein
MSAMQRDGLEGEVAFVTRGAGGIGRCITETLRDVGAIVASGDLEAGQLHDRKVVDVNGGFVIA